MAIMGMAAPEVRGPVQGLDLLEKWLEFRDKCLDTVAIDHPEHVRIADPYR
ncbi:hypothetical protein [Nocardioides coralli]|uniref:hypothetical protein n=1 Tax=Nocardioides coralli TaxID=2872154 RepID=UPI001CA43510|nr:hypothetical protein [Nocardioides coralli]QZY28832.1 hypothetical protein K6T13_15480 [Nocardioides coralli]